MAETIATRTVVHFPGFEPLDAAAHHARYVHSAQQSGKVWDCRFDVGALNGDGVSFDVEGSGPDWSTRTRVHVLDHDACVAMYRNRPLVVRLARGFGAAGRTILDGGMAGYFKQAWRFGLFFVFPFLAVAVGIAAAIGLALGPVFFGFAWPHLLWSAPLALGLFVRVYLPAVERFHAMHLFSDWEMAVAMARLDDPAINARLSACEEFMRAALREEADEILITSHSMGSNLAVHVLGALLEKTSDLLDGRRVVFVTLGGAVAQCALMRPAGLLRRRVGRIARDAAVTWLDVQCLTDVVNFYRSRTVALCGHADAPQARTVLVRFRHMLEPAHYRRIKRDILRVHRQYVLGPDRRAGFDFTLMTAGPFAAERFVSFSAHTLPPLRDDGSLVSSAAAKRADALD